MSRNIQAMDDVLKSIIIEQLQLEVREEFMEWPLINERINDNDDFMLRVWNLPRVMMKKIFIFFFFVYFSCARKDFFLLRKPNTSLN